jgi:hypothetical protein
MGILPIVDVGDAFEPCGQSSSDLLLSHITITPRPLAARHIEHTVIMEVGHDSVEVVAIEGI